MYCNVTYHNGTIVIVAVFTLLVELLDVHLCSFAYISAVLCYFDGL